MSTNVYKSGSRWCWSVEEFGSVLESGHAPNRTLAQERARFARHEIASVTPGGITGKLERARGYKLPRLSRRDVFPVSEEED